MTRTHVVGALAALLAAVPFEAQQQPDTATPPPRPALDGRLRAEITLIKAVLRTVSVPSAEAFTLGDREIAAGVQTGGPVAVARGTLTVSGRIPGDALVLHGDIVVLPGGSIGGNAVTVDGRVRPSGGIIEGDVRSIRGLTGSILARAAGRAAAERPPDMMASLKLVLGWFAVLFVIGVGVLLFAEANLDGVVRALEHQFSRSFWTGLLAQLGAIPALLLAVLALCITLIGILLVPFAIVAFVIGLAGLVTLGFIAVARFTGRAFVHSTAATRGVHLQALVAGLAVYLGLWFLAAAFVWTPVAASVLRAIALAGTWVALTFGLGATILTRAGTRRKDAPRAERPADEYSWQTPTPVTGVVAARRPGATVKQS